MHKYKGRTIAIIYLDRHGNFTQRRIRVQSVQDNCIKAYDLDKRSPRIFRAENILAYQPEAPAKTLQRCFHIEGFLLPTFCPHDAKF